MKRNRDALFLAALAVTFGVLLAAFLAFMVLLVDMYGHLKKDQLILKENVLSQSLSMHRVIFAVAKLFADDGSDANEKNLDGKIEKCRAVLGHASIPGGLDAYTIEHILGADPLLLKDRYRDASARYRDKCEELLYLYNQLKAAPPGDQKRSLIEDFEAGTIEFLEIVEHHSHLLNQLGSVYSSHVKDDFEGISSRLEVFFTIISLASVLLCAVVFIFTRYRMTIEKKLRAHQEHLEELVENRTHELSLRNVQLQREVKERRQAEKRLESTVEALRAALQKVKTLSGLLPICCNCKKIRDDEGFWHQVETYVRNHSDAEFSHSLCPDCMGELYPDLALEKKRGARG